MEWGARFVTEAGKETATETVLSYLEYVMGAPMEDV
jgi:hypothetical protein